MPAKNGLRLNDMRRTEQARPAPGHPDQQGAVTAAQSKTRRRTPQGDAELMAEEQVLGFKPARGLEEVNDEHCERIKEREHRSRSCDDSTRQCDSQAGWDFRKGQVSTCRNSCCGCLRPPCGGTDAMVPSMILSSACCTPSPDTSRVIDGLSDLRLILSISSM